jgi:hypothetical protein
MANTKNGSQQKQHILFCCTIQVKTLMLERGIVIDSNKIRVKNEGDLVVVVRVDPCSSKSRPVLKRFYYKVC